MCRRKKNYQSIKLTEKNTYMCPPDRLVLCNFVVYSTELSPEFLERWPVLGVVLPAAAHDPGDFHGAAVRSSHTVP